MGNHIALLNQSEDGALRVVGEFDTTTAARKHLREVEPGLYHIHSVLEAGIPVEEPVSVVKAVVGQGTRNRTRKPRTVEAQ